MKWLTFRVRRFLNFLKPYFLQLCTELRLCSSAVEDYEDIEDVVEYDSSEEEEELEDRPYCPMCEYIVGELDRYMTDNRTEEYIQETVEQICDMLR